MSDLLFVGLALLVVVGGILARRRTRQNRAGLTDELVREIETMGRVDAEDVEPLDLEGAREEEDAFWAQTWDEPEDPL